MTKTDAPTSGVKCVNCGHQHTIATICDYRSGPPEYPDYCDCTAFELALPSTMLDIERLNNDDLLALACRDPQNDGRRGYYIHRVMDVLRRLAQEQG